MNQNEEILMNELLQSEVAIVTMHIVKKDGTFSKREVTYLTDTPDKYQAMVGTLTTVPMAGRQQHVIVCHVSGDKEETKKGLMNAGFPLAKFVKI